MDLGSGVLAVWNDVAPEAEREFNDWYLREHLLERLSLPGFLRARRWWNPERSPRYFTFYETSEVSTLHSREYVARLENPTAWTRRIMPAFRSTSRSACSVLARIRSGDGSVAGVLRLAPDERDAARLSEWLAREALPRMASLRGVMAVQLWASDRATTGTSRLEATLRPGADAVIDWAVVIEATRGDEAEEALAVLSGAADHGARSVEPPEQFNLLCAMSR